MNLESYVDRVLAVCEPFVGHASNDYARSCLKTGVVLERQYFLAANPGYVADGDVEVTNDRGMISVKADVITVEERDRRERAARELRELVQSETLKAKRAVANLQRQHRRLLAKHEARIPVATRSVWGTFSIGQQYAILKDIDYAERHG